MKEEPNVDSPFFAAFPSNRISKAIKDAPVHFFFHSCNFCKLYQRIWGTFWNYYVDAIPSGRAV